MKRLKSSLVMLAVVSLAAPWGVAAQRGPQGRGGPGMDRGMAGMQRMGQARGGSGVEAILRMKDRLELTDDQFRQLDELRAASVQHRNAQRAVMEEYRSKIASGQMERSELQTIMESRREEMEGLRSQHQERIQSILTEGQRTQIRELQARARAFQRGRASAMRGQRGMRQGMRLSLIHI